MSDLSSALQPLFLSAVPFGVSPFTVENHAVILKRAYTIFAIMILTFLTSLYAYVFIFEPVSGLYSDLEEALPAQSMLRTHIPKHPVTKGFIEESTDSLESYVSAIASCVCIWRSVANRKKVATIVNKLQWFDSILKKQEHNQQNPVRNTYFLWPNSSLFTIIDTNNRKVVLRTILIFITSWVWFIAAGILEMINYPKETITQWAMYVIPVGVTTQMTIQFVVISTAVRWRFKDLNNLITKQRITNDLCNFVMASHDFLCEIISVLKDAYRDQVLAVMGQSSVTIVASAFYVANSILHSAEDNTGWLYGYTLLTSTYCFLQMASVVWASVQLSLEVKRTVRLSFADTVRFDEDNSSRLLFAFQGLQTEDKFELCRGFPVDGSLLSNLADTVTTYLLIVIQFEVNLMEQPNK